ncbi:hypothetical protein GCM10012275_37010 [Longimycelium tulufanense]|uniref:Putative zinc-finger domain-containing protein n=1 Tax=Longimycelium tulufanense TaxID=907463 RepID=A0A8J3FWV0_9PSEU|nr:zf-HC2 domain-containing protein [Longimycelium tulufanense]GGM62929.1 hypothetical protein GCM10012275_37010 [Longimycelium tulufanense]
MARLLQVYLDSQVDETTAEAVAQHLRDCGDCGLEARTYRAIKRAVARRSVPTPEAVRRLRTFAEELLNRDQGEHSV